MSSKPPGRFSLSRRLQSFSYAMRGIGHLFRHEHNVWIHFAATALVIFCGFAFDIALRDWLYLVIAFGLVWVCEALNTAIEYLADAISLERMESIQHAKDIAAAAVLLAAIFAVAIGVLVFYPYLRH